MVMFFHHVLTVYAQQVTFSKVFSNYGLSAENGMNIIEFENGYLLIAANGCSQNSDLDCMTIYKLNQFGNIEWTKEYQHYGTRKKQIAILGDKIYLSGRTRTIDYQYLLYCLDFEGNIIWEKEFGDPNKNEWSPNLLLTHSNNLILSDSRDRNQNHMYEWLPVLIKVNTEGDSLAEFTFNEDYDASTIGQLIESTEHDFIASYVYCPDGCAFDLKAGVTCLDSVGEVKWRIDFPYSYLPENCLVNQIDSSALAVKWYIDSDLPNHDLSPPALFFTDMQGNIQDTFIFENQSLKEVHSMESIWERGLVGCGRNYIDYLTSSDSPLAGWAFRLGENRQMAWERTYLDTTYQGESFGLRQIIPTSDGGYIATGTITNFMTGVWESHNWILKLDSLGCLEPNCGGLNYVSITEEVVFLKGKGVKIYPNPASDYVQVAFPTDFSLKDLTLHLISNDGRQIKQTPINTNNQLLLLPDIMSGIYHAIITRCNEIITSQRVIIHH